MLSVGITGGIGSGKSTVCRVFELLNVPIFYADAEARRLQDEDAEIKSAMISLLGNDIYTLAGLNRKAVAEKVFTNKLLLEQLNKIIHPATINAFIKWKEIHGKSPYILKEAAILFESDSHIDLDKIIAVTAPEELRMERIINRDHISRAQVISRMKNQLSDEERKIRSDFVIINDEKIAIIPQVMKVHEKLMHLIN